MSFNRVDRLSQYLMAKYAVNIDEVRHSLTNFYYTWLVGNPGKGIKTPDQTIVEWSQMGKGEEFDQILELLDIVMDLGKNSKTLSVPKLYARVSRAMNIAQTLKDQTITAIKEEIIKATQGIKKTNINELNRREVKIRTFLRMLDSVYEKARKALGSTLKPEEKKAIDEGQLSLLKEDERVGSYENQKPSDISDDQIERFRITPEAEKYGFSDPNVISELRRDPEIEPLIHALIRSVKRGHDPKAAPEVEAQARKIRQILDLRNKTNAPYFEIGEEEAKELGRPKYVLPSSKRDQESTQREKEELEEAKFQELQKQIKQRDEAHQRRQEEEKQMEEERQRHIRSEGAVLLKALIKKRYL